MGTSLPIYHKDIKDHITALQPKTILDVGPGMGTYYDIIKSIDSTITCDAVEPTKNYVIDFDLKSKYNNVFEQEIQEFVKTNINRYDLCIMGDILEHLFLSEAIDVIDALSYRCKNLMIVWPTNLYQHTDNIYETHKSNFYLHDLTRFNIQIYKKTFLAFDYTIPVEIHYALIAGHMTGKNEVLRTAITGENQVYGVRNDL